MTSHVLSQPAIQDRMKPAEAEQLKQYTLWQILGIWALVTLPMALLVWVIASALIPHSPFLPGITYWLLIIAGMAWESVVALVIIYRELGTLRWSAIRQRTWLQTPRDPKTDRPNANLYWWVLPPLLLDVLVIVVLGGYLDAPMTWLFPGVQAPAYTEMAQLISPEFKGQWWLLGITLVSFIFNYFLAEEFSGTAYSCPRCKGFLESTIGWQTPFCSVFIM